jgi:hypothetical protein
MAIPAPDTDARLVIWAGWLCVAAALIVQCAAALGPLEVLVDSVFSRDDAFYYFKIARSIAAGHGATFDGIHATSGVQYLWMGFLIPLAWVFDDPVTYLRAVLFLCIALNLIAAFLFLRLCRMVHSDILAGIALILWAGVLAERWNTLQGMEYSLHIVILLETAIVAWRFVTGRDWTLSLLLGLLLALNFWTRLDSAVLSAALWLLAVAMVLRHADRRAAHIAALTLPGLIAAALYIAVSYAMAGTPLPLSGAVKSWYAGRYFQDVSATAAIIEQLRMWTKIQVSGVLALVPSSVIEIGLAETINPFSKPQHLIAALIFLAGLGLIALRLLRPSPDRRLMLACAFGVVVAGLQSALAVLVMKSFAPVSRHYYALHLIVWIVLGGCLILSLVRLIPASFRRPAAALLIVANALPYVLIANGLLSARPGVNNYAIARLRLAADLNRTLPPDAIVGAWNAGVLGYFLDRPVVNLDGLVNDRDFLAVLRAGTPLTGYLHAEGIGWLIDHNKQDLTLRFREKRDTMTDFRNGIPWTALEPVTQLGEVQVLRVR